jgi:transcriptional regulator with PAS, ATPase and Fis domain
MSNADRTEDTRAPRRPPGTPLIADRLPPIPPARPIIALRVIDGTVELPIPLSGNRHVLTLGSAKSEVDLYLKADGVSRRHLTIQAQGNQLEIVDTSSRNGTYFGPIGHEERESSRCVAAGDIFRIAGTHVIALDQDLIELRAHMQRVIGYDAHRAVHVALSTVAATRPLLIVGKLGCDHAALAHAVHRYSKRRAGPFSEVPSPQPPPDFLQRAWGGTVFLDLDAVDAPSASLVARVLDPTVHVRLIVAATSWRAVERAFGKERARVLAASLVELVPLGARPADVPRIFDALFASELNSDRTIAGLGAKNVEALVAHRWRDNIAGIRRVLDKIHARIGSATTAEAADFLGITRQSFSGTLDALGLVFDAEGPRIVRRRAPARRTS